MVCKYIEIKTEQEYVKFKLLTSYLNFKLTPIKEIPCYFYLYFNNKEKMACNNRKITYGNEKPEIGKKSNLSNEVVTEITLEELEKIDQSDLF